MPLTKQDVSQIKGIVRGEIESLARIVARGFKQVDKRFEQVDKRFEQVDRRLEHIDRHLKHIDARLDTLEHDVAEIRKHLVYRDEFEVVLARLSVIEKKLGIRNGK